MIFASFLSSSTINTFTNPIKMPIYFFILMSNSKQETLEFDWNIPLFFKEILMLIRYIGQRL